jgi:hypothetical protein
LRLRCFGYSGFLCASQCQKTENCKLSEDWLSRFPPLRHLRTYESGGIPDCAKIKEPLQKVLPAPLMSIQTGADRLGKPANLVPALLRSTVPELKKPFRDRLTLAACELAAEMRSRIERRRG